MYRQFDAMIWIDEHEAKVFHLKATSVDRTVILMHDYMLQEKRLAYHDDGPADEQFLRRVTDAVATSLSLLLFGPGNVKDQLGKYIAAHSPPLFAKVTIAPPEADSLPE